MKSTSSSSSSSEAARYITSDSINHSQFTTFTVCLVVKSRQLNSIHRSAASRRLVQDFSARKGHFGSAWHLYDHIPENWKCRYKSTSGVTILVTGNGAPHAASALSRRDQGIERRVHSRSKNPKEGFMHFRQRLFKGEHDRLTTLCVLLGRMRIGANFLISPLHYNSRS